LQIELDFIKGRSLTALLKHWGR